MKRERKKLKHKLIHCLSSNNDFLRIAREDGLCQAYLGGKGNKGKWVSYVDADYLCPNCTVIDEWKE